MKQTLINLVLFIILAQPLAFAEYWIKYDTTSTPANQVERFQGDCKSLSLCTGPNHDGLQSNVFEATEPEFNSAGASFKKADPNASVGSRVIDWTAQEISDFNAVQAATAEASLRTGSKSQFNGNNVQALGLRCLAKAVLDEINVLRTRDRDRAVDVATATNLADLKVKWALRSSLDDRTLTQAKTAIQNCVDLKTADE